MSGGPDWLELMNNGSAGYWSWRNAYLRHALGGGRAVTVSPERQDSKMNDASDAARVKADRHERYLDVFEALDRCKTMMSHANADRMNGADRADYECEHLKRARTAAMRLLAALKELELP